ncbi:hypothetical protein [Bacillus cereus]|uniref:hypothetical protein n=1 Tax=Bacillus cereus TaxID=1396 RepID=UPI000B4BF888|nr:hypothetical protein [Bacillus cereus]
MITRNNQKDKSLIKDKVKRVVLCLVVAASLVVTGSLVYNCFKVSTAGQGATANKTKEVQIVTKEVEKVVGEKIEKTKETTTTQNPEKKPTGFQEFAIELFNSKTIGTVVFQHFLMYLGIALLHLLFLASMKGVNSLKVPGLEIGTDKVETEQIAKKLEDQSIKLELLEFWVNDKNKTAFAQTVTDQSFLGYMTAMLEKIQDYYSYEWDSNFSFKIYTMQEFQDSDLPSIVKKSAVVIDESNIGLPINKEEDLPFHSNYLIYKVEEVDVSNATNVKQHMIVLSSYNSSFVKADGTVLAGVCSVANSVYNDFAKAQFIMSLIVQCQDLTMENQALTLQIQQNQTQQS